MSVIKITESSISCCMSTQLRIFLPGCGVEITRALPLGVAGDIAGGLRWSPQHRGLINSQPFTEENDSQLGDPLGASYASSQTLGGLLTGMMEGPLPHTSIFFIAITVYT